MLHDGALCVRVVLPLSGILLEGSFLGLQAAIIALPVARLLLPGSFMGCFRDLHLCIQQLLRQLASMP